MTIKCPCCGMWGPPGRFKEVLQRDLFDLRVREVTSKGRGKIENRYPEVSGLEQFAGMFRRMFLDRFRWLAECFGGGVWSPQNVEREVMSPVFLQSPASCSRTLDSPSTVIRVAL